MRDRGRISGGLWLVLLALAVTPACRQDMQDQPRYEPLEGSAFFADGRAARPLLPGTVARGQLRGDTRFYTGRGDEDFSEVFPAPVTAAMLARGRERYDIFCSPCHDRAGYGRGMIVQRGYKQPPSLHDERLREMPPGYFFHVISNGFGVMPAYAVQVSPADRWAIVAYLRALQRSQDARLADVPPTARAALEPDDA